MGQSSWVHLEDCHIRRTTEKAICIMWDGAEYWLPRSQVADEGDNLAEGDRGVTVSITQWIAEQKEIEAE